MCKFGSYTYAIVSDTEKVFLQISLIEKRREYTKFIWFKNENIVDIEISLRYFPETLKYWVGIQRVSLSSWGKGALKTWLATFLVVVDILLHRPSSHLIFSYWVG